jgi:phosphoglycerate dehydrogenase-like enzyme
MAWPGVPSANLPSSSSLATTSPSMDMKMYEVMEHLRSMQNVQAEQSRRLDEQSYRLHQLEMKDMSSHRLENQRYLWGPGAVGSTPSKALSGLGFEVFSPVKEKEKEKEMEVPVTVEEISTNGISH